MEGMHTCLNTLETDFQHILVDGNYFTPYKEIPHDCVIKGDNTYYSIAAASILAKVSRDEYMKKLHEEYPKYKWDGNKGYGSADHIEMIKKAGISKTPPRIFLNTFILNLSLNCSCIFISFQIRNKSPFNRRFSILICH